MEGAIFIKEPGKGPNFIHIIKIVIVFTPVLFCVAIFRYVELMLSNPALSSTEQAISLLLAMFGIVISVWVALNIYNAIAQKELEKLVHLEDDVAELETRTEQATRLTSQFPETLTSLLISRLCVSLAHYASTDYIIDRMRENVSSLSGSTLSQLLELEDLFISASEANRAKSDSIRIDLARRGATLCEVIENAVKEDLSSKKENPFLAGYLALRKGDFYYYWGVRTGEEQLKRAIESYSKADATWFSTVKKTR